MHVLICAVSSSRQPSGICRHAANLAHSLAGRREVTAVTLLVGEWQAQYFRHAFGLQDPKLQIVAVNISCGALARNAWYIRRLPSVASEYGPEVVHLAFPIPFNRSRLNCPVVTSLHDLYPFDIPENFGLPRVMFNRMFLRQCLRGSSSVVCSSEFTLGRLRLFAPNIASTKAVRIYQSVEFGRINGEKPAIPEMNGRRFLLSVAQHRRNKNLEILLKGFAELLRRGSQWKGMCLLIVGGKGPETAHLERVVRQLALQRQVIFHAGVTDEELSWLYANCETLVAPSSIEGFGLPVVEALQCDARVVCSDIPAFREVAGNDAQYFDLHASSPAKALADAATVAIQTPAKWTEAPARFSADSIAVQHLSLYSKLLSTHKSCTDETEVLAVDRPIRYGRYPS